MYILGITGKSGSGKSTFAYKLKESLNESCTLIDVDLVQRTVLHSEEITKYITNIFGSKVIGADGKIDRKKLGNIFFNNVEKYKYVSDKMWKQMKIELQNKIEDCKTSISILDWILLPQSEEFWKNCNCRILVVADTNLRKEKILLRDKVTSEYFDKRENASIEYTNADFDYIFTNDYTNETMEYNINKILEYLKG